MSAGRHLGVGPLTSSGQPADFTLYKNTKKKNKGHFLWKGGDKSEEFTGDEAEGGHFALEYRGVVKCQAWRFNP